MVIDRFESGSFGRLAPNWYFQPYGHNSATTSIDTVRPKEGRRAQEMSCSSFQSGGVQIFRTGIQVKRGMPYVIAVWMRGSVRQPVHILLRKLESPYTRYVSSLVRVSPEWRQYVVEGIASATDSAAGLYISMRGEGNLVMDSVVVLSGTVPRARTPFGPASKGNKVANSGFENGANAWTPPWSFIARPEAGMDGTMGTLLRSSAMESRPFAFSPGLVHTVSFYAKSVNGPSRISASVFEWIDEGLDQHTDRPSIDSTFMTDQTWVRYSYTGVVRPTISPMAVLRLSSSADVLIDNIQVEEGELTAYVPQSMTEVGIESDRNVYTRGDTCVLRIRVASDLRNTSKTMELKIEDLWGTTVSQLNRIPVTGLSPAKIPLRRTGLFRAVCVVDGIRKAEISFGVFAPVRPAASWGGIHVRCDGGNGKELIELVHRAGFRSVRLHDFCDVTYWYRVEPVKGSYQWHDAEVAALASRGLDILGNLGAPPQWTADPASAGPSARWTNIPPDPAGEWSRYVGDVVSHYSPWIRKWEVWNEPFVNGFFAGPPERYAPLYRSARVAATARFPSARLLASGIFLEDAGWTKRALQGISPDSLDGLTFHAYWDESSANDAAPGGMSLRRDLVSLRQLLNERGMKVPVSMTEGGCRALPFESWIPYDDWLPHPRKSAAAMVKGIVELLGSGCDALYLYYLGGKRDKYLYSDVWNGATGLVDYAGVPKSTFLAAHTCLQLLPEMREHWLERTENATVHCFRQKDGWMAVVWCAQDRSLQNSPLAVFDMMGNRRTSGLLRAGEPVFVRLPDRTKNEHISLLRGAGF